MNKNFMYGLGAVKYNDFVIGYIEKGSFDLNGQKPEAAKIEAEQAPGAPVLIIPQSNGSIAPTFNVIQTDYKNMHVLLGGTLHYAKEDSQKKNPTGWTAPQAALLMQGHFELALVSGRSILIPNGTLLSNLGGKLTLTETAKIECAGGGYAGGWFAALRCIRYGSPARRVGAAQAACSGSSGCLCTDIEPERLTYGQPAGTTDRDGVCGCAAGQRRVRSS